MIKRIGIRLKMDDDLGEGVVEVSDAFKAEHIVHQIDCLNDWITDLVNLRETVMEKCYGNTDTKRAV